MEEDENKKCNETKLFLYNKNVKTNKYHMNECICDLQILIYWETDGQSHL